MTYPIDPRYDAYMNRGVHTPEGFMSIKDDGLEECEMFCGTYHDNINWVGNTLEALLSEDGPFIEEAESYLKTGHLY